MSRGRCFNGDLLLTDAEAAWSRLDQEVAARPGQDESADPTKKHLHCSGVSMSCEKRCSFARKGGFFSSRVCQRQQITQLEIREEIQPHPAAAITGEMLIFLVQLCCY